MILPKHRSSKPRRTTLFVVLRLCCSLSLCSVVTAFPLRPVTSVLCATNLPTPEELQSNARAPPSAEIETPEPEYFLPRKRDVWKNRLLFWRSSSSEATARDADDEAGGPDDGPGAVAAPKPGSVFEESKTMLILSDMVYVLTALRKFARATDDAALQERLSVPRISSELVPPILENVHLLEKGADFDADFSGRVVQLLNRAELIRNSPENSEVVYIGDSADDGADSCVYGISVNRSVRRITVWFRGTVSSEGPKQWKKNLDTTLRREENPIDELLDANLVVGVHRGFARALLGRRRKIVLEILRYKREHPETRDFPLYVSGHSLGGALATLFGFYACQEREFTRCGPVRVYTFAAPPVGDRAFGEVFRHLEDAGRLRLARIHNAQDPVPSAFALTRYAHVGLGIVLDFPDYEVVEEDRSSLGKIRMIVGGYREHKLSRSYEYLNRHAVGFNTTLDNFYLERSKLG